MIRFISDSAVELVFSSLTQRGCCITGKRVAIEKAISGQRKKKWWDYIIKAKDKKGTMDDYSVLT